MTKQTAEQWLREEVEKLGFTAKDTYEENVVLMLKHINGADLWLNKDDTVSVIGTLHILYYKKLIEIAEKYKELKDE